MTTSTNERPATEYGPWTRGNMGQVGRTVTTWWPSLLVPGDWTPVLDWEPHRDQRPNNLHSDPRRSPCAPA